MITMKDKSAYFAGSFALQIITGTLSSYLMLYHTNVLGISALASGTLFLVARCIDAFTDLAMANIADKTQTRFGKYRPYILFGAIPIGIIFFLNFAAPGFVMAMGDTGKLIWAYVTYLLAGSIMATICGVPFGSLNSVMSDQVNDRNVFAASRAIAENAASLATSGLTMTLILAFGTVNDPQGWRVMGAIFGILGVVGFLYCAWGVRERVHEDAKAKVSFIKSLKVLKGNGPAFACMGILFLFILEATYFGIFGAYFCIFSLNHPEWTAPLMSIAYGTGFIAAFFIPGLAKKIEKRNIIVLGCTFAIVGFGIMYFVYSFPLLIIANVLYGLGFGLVLPNLWALIPEAADFGEWKNGIGAPAFLYAACMLVLKVSSGLANYIVGLFLTLAGYDASLAVQEAATQQAIRTYTALGPIVLALLVILCSLFLKKIDRDKVTRMNEELAVRRSSQEPEPVALGVE